MYDVGFSKSSKNFIKKIPKKDAEIVLRKIYSLREDPFRFLKRLQGHKLWRLRVLKYRAHIDVVISKNKVIVVRIGYIKNIY